MASEKLSRRPQVSTHNGFLIVGGLPAMNEREARNFVRRMQCACLQRTMRPKRGWLYEPKSGRTIYEITLDPDGVFICATLENASEPYLVERVPYEKRKALWEALRAAYQRILEPDPSPGTRKPLAVVKPPDQQSRPAERKRAVARIKRKGAKNEQDSAQSHVRSTHEPTRVMREKYLSGRSWLVLRSVADGGVVLGVEVRAEGQTFWGRGSVLRVTAAEAATLAEMVASRRSMRVDRVSQVSRTMQFARVGATEWHVVRRAQRCRLFESVCREVQAWLEEFAIDRAKLHCQEIRATGTEDAVGAVGMDLATRASAHGHAGHAVYIASRCTGRATRATDHAKQQPPTDPIRRSCDRSYDSRSCDRSYDRGMAQQSLALDGGWAKVAAKPKRQASPAQRFLREYARRVAEKSGSRMAFSYKRDVALVQRVLNRERDNAMKRGRSKAEALIAAEKTLLAVLDQAWATGVFDWHLANERTPPVPVFVNAYQVKRAELERLKRRGAKVEDAAIEEVRAQVLARYAGGYDDLPEAALRDAVRAALGDEAADREVAHHRAYIARREEIAKRARRRA